MIQKIIIINYSLIAGKRNLKMNFHFLKKARRSMNILKYDKQLVKKEWWA